MHKKSSWAWVSKIGDRQTGTCYFVREVSVLKASLPATSVAQILITYPISNQNGHGCDIIKSATT